MLDRQHLAILREVKRAGSLTAAADRLHLTQSALSHAITKFEERHDVKVWTKQGRALRFTEAGEHLLDLAERLLPQLEHGEQLLDDMAAGRRGLLRVGMECHPCQRWLTNVISPFLAEWPDVDLEVRSAFRFDGVSALTGYEIDVLVTPDPIYLPALKYQPIFDYELVLVMHEDHRLAAKRYVAPADLVDEELITVPVSLERLDVYSRFLVPANRRPRRQRTAETVELMLQLVAAGRGVSVLPDWLLPQYAANLPVKSVGLGRKGLAKSLYVATRVSDHERDYVSGFVRLARQVQP